nr:(2Fe-2S) ferredoxin domain-containing protein [uncultured Holophaga sp.]
MTRNKELPKEIVVCMGSACFSRGNVKSVQIIQSYLQEKGLDKDVKVTGTLCQDACKEGPNVCFGGSCLCKVDPSTLQDLLDEQFGYK